MSWKIPDNPLINSLASNTFFLIMLWLHVFANEIYTYFFVHPKKQTLCGAHILREFYALEEQGSLWAKHFRRYFLAERDLRPFKTKLKITGGFRSLEGAKRQSRIFGFIASMHKQGKNIFQEIKALFQETNPKIA